MYIAISPQKKESLKKYIWEIMKEYAIAFNREINGRPIFGNNIKYFAKVKHQRHFRGTDGKIKENSPFIKRITVLEKQIRKVLQEEIFENVLEDGQKMILLCSREDQKMVFPSPKEGQNMVHPCPEEGQKMVHRCPEEDQNLVSNINTYKHINTKKTNKAESEKEVINFFRSKKWKAVEGQKFFHHYQSIGWKKSWSNSLKGLARSSRKFDCKRNGIKSFGSSLVRMRNQDNLKITKTEHYDKHSGRRSDLPLGQAKGRSGCR